MPQNQPEWWDWAPAELDTPAGPVRRRHPASLPIDWLTPEQSDVLPQGYDDAKRIMDLALAVPVLLLITPFLLLIPLLIRLSSAGPAIYWSERIGRWNRPFLMPKFRTMRMGTPELAKPELENPTEHLTLVGRWLRRWSLDELPQIYSILMGRMSFVGPRPLLAREAEIHEGRLKMGISALMPGLTGWAQINGRDHVSVEEKLQLEREYLQKWSVGFDLRIILATAWKVLTSEGVSH